MPAMLPAPRPDRPSLADVLTGCLAAITEGGGRLGLPRARSAVVLLVDGLGQAALRARSGHARRLAAAAWPLQTVFPTTTAAALGSLHTGQPPSAHGLVGYHVLDPAADRVVGLLNGWDARMRPDEWQRCRTVYERCGPETDAIAIGPAKHADSGFTRAVLRGARYLPAKTIAGRFTEAAAVLSRRRPVLLYLYVPELDQIAHAHGWESERWTAALEEVESQLAGLVDRLPRDVGVLATADHGILDVPRERHVLVDEEPGLLEGVRHVGGEPRCLQLYLEPGADPGTVLKTWRAAEGERSWVLSRAEARAAGLFGPDLDEVVGPRTGDVLVAARRRIAYYDGRRASEASRRMVGQHGSLSDEERIVPLARFGAFAD